MTVNEQEDAKTYLVVVNHEEQYSLWPLGKEIPIGWREAGASGSKDDCLAYIKDVWTDMRPLSLRQKMDTARHETNIVAYRDDGSCEPGHF
ncbi:MbtH family protein [Dictyobacter alpinus]|uniref:MbtH family protein n=1 Tax=Dictyobacter alpinus TaxID=2014873 RepID=A0A402B8D6_9CHLR|nr:MbtH family protein [Dictyobacter alpinus]